MEMDADTFLTAVYCLVDDLYQAQYAAHKPRRPGRKAVMSDSEVLTLVILEQWRPDRKERGFLRWVRTHWHAYFPHLLSQSAFNRRTRDLWGVLCQLGPQLSQVVQATVGEEAGYEVLDAVPVPLMRRCRGERHRLFADEAAIGRGGSDRDWYYGCSLLDVVRPEGTISGFVLGPANTEGRWLAEALLRWRQDPTRPAPTAAELAPVLGPTRLPGGRTGPTGPVGPRLGVGPDDAALYLGDGGFQGRHWQAHWQREYAAAVLTYRDDALQPAPGQQRALHHFYASFRQVVETIHSLLDDLFGLAYPRARTYWGLLTRLAAKVAALNLLVFCNYLAGRNPFQHFNPLED